MFYRTDTNARGFWLPANARLKTFMLENFLEINRYFALTPLCNTIGQSNNAFFILGFSGGKTKRPCFDLFIHWLIKQITNTYQNHFSRSYENHSMQIKWSLPYIFVLMPFCISVDYTNWNFCVKSIHYSFYHSARRRAVSLQSVESKLGRTGESEMAFLPLENKIHIFAPPCNILYLFYFLFFIFF